MPSGQLLPRPDGATRVPANAEPRREGMQLIFSVSRQAEQRRHPDSADDWPIQLPPRYERGWEQVSARLDWASKGIAATERSEENSVTVVGEDLAYTVDLEHMTRNVGGQPRPYTLRCTQAYRLERGEWKIVLRHADELLQKDEQQS